MDKSALNIIAYYQEQAPVDVFAIIEELGIELDVYPFGKDLSGLAGYIENDEGLFTIGVNAFDHLVRQRFTAAHELGHYLYHRSLIGDGVDDTRAYRSLPGGKFSNSNIRPMHERQANQFAANLLMPKRLISRLKRRGLRTPAQLANALQVSRPAMRIQLGLPPEPLDDEDGDFVLEDDEFDQVWEEPNFRRR